ncbi:MAG TPA: hypothetical protein PKC18_14490, partial [Lacipirellulaceae bacterium]|nr:hypothetical protein [Lacipirellulaceae bacterium]
MPDQVPAAVQQERLRELAAVETELRDAYFASLRGMTLRVLVESAIGEGPTDSRPPTRLVGTSCRYAPT